jgi:hypothetical protein
MTQSTIKPPLPPYSPPTTLSTEELLGFALRMLDTAREEQARSKRQFKWLTGNEMLEAIRQRVAEGRKA